MDSHDRLRQVARIQARSEYPDLRDGTSTDRRRRATDLRSRNADDVLPKDVSMECSANELAGRAPQTIAGLELPCWLMTTCPLLAVFSFLHSPPGLQELAISRLPPESRSGQSVSLKWVSTEKDFPNTSRNLNRTILRILTRPQDK